MSLVAEPEELKATWLAQTKREYRAHYASPMGAGLLQPRDYVLLAACRPNEYAYEYAASGNSERHGALTYWLINTLNNAAIKGQPLSYRLLHDRINAKVNSKFPQQTPMILGECDRIVFDTKTWPTPYTVTVISAQGDTLRLNAGQAQGLSRGTRLSIFALGTTDFSDEQQQIAIVELVAVDGTESTCEGGARRGWGN